MYLNSSVAAGDRVIDLSIQSNNLTYTPAPSTPLSPLSPSSAPADTGETLRTLVVPTIAPIIAEDLVKYRRSTAMQPGLAELSTYSDQYWDGAGCGIAIVSTTWTCVAPHGLKVESAKLSRGVSRSYQRDDAANHLLGWVACQSLRLPSGHGLRRPSHRYTTKL